MKVPSATIFDHSLLHNRREEAQLVTSHSLTGMFANQVATQSVSSLVRSILSFPIRAVKASQEKPTSQSDVIPSQTKPPLSPCHRVAMDTFDAVSVLNQQVLPSFKFKAADKMATRAQGKVQPGMVQSIAATLEQVENSFPCALLLFEQQLVSIEDKLAECTSNTSLEAFSHETACVINSNVEEIKHRVRQYFSEQHAITNTHSLIELNRFKDKLKHLECQLQSLSEVLNQQDDEALSSYFTILAEHITYLLYAIDHSALEIINELPSFPKAEADHIISTILQWRASQSQADLYKLSARHYAQVTPLIDFVEQIADSGFLTTDKVSLDTIWNMTCLHDYLQRWLPLIQEIANTENAQQGIRHEHGFSAQILNELTDYAAHFFNGYALCYETETHHSLRVEPNRITALIEELDEIKQRYPAAFEKAWQKINSPIVVEILLEQRMEPNTEPRYSPHLPTASMTTAASGDSAASANLAKDEGDSSTPLEPHNILTESSSWQDLCDYGDITKLVKKQSKRVFDAVKAISLFENLLDEVDNEILWERHLLHDPFILVRTRLGDVNQLPENIVLPLHSLAHEFLENLPERYDPVTILAALPHIKQLPKKQRVIAHVYALRASLATRILEDDIDPNDVIVL